MEGTLGHFKGFADLWQADHLWDVVVRLKGKPTFLIGRAEDPDFEAHLREGTYFVLDDVALDKYKHDPRVTFIPGSPIGNEMMPVIMEALGVDLPGKTAEQALRAWTALQARWIHETGLAEGRSTRLALLLTWMFGPAGLTLFLAQRALRRRR